MITTFFPHSSKSMPSPELYSLNEMNRSFVCPARGLSREHHNPNTAVLEIPSDASHGLLLTCSQSECANSKRAFRYCKVCDIPVAKKNFISLHGHGVIKTSRDMDGIGVGIHRGTFPSQPLSHSTTRDYMISANNSDNNLRHSKTLGPVLSAETNRVCCEEFMKSPSCLEIVTYKASPKRVEAYDRFLSDFPADLVTRKTTLKSIGNCKEHSSLTNNPTITGVRYENASNLESDMARKAKDETQSFRNEIGDSLMDENLNLPVVTGDDLIAYFDWIHYDGTIFD